VRRWYLVIDNDPSWRTKISGNTLIGAASLTSEEFKRIRLQVKKDETYLTFSLSGMASVTKDFEKERRVPLKMSDFAVGISE
jgi:CYTH domain-containing protein